MNAATMKREMPWAMNEINRLRTRPRRSMTRD
jgi:hypothetical protein